MSATGRGGAALALPGLETTVGRHPDDFYRTPGWAVDAILPHLREPRRWLDPGCGDGAIAERVIARWPRSEGIGVELDAARARAARRLPFLVFQGDFLRRGAVWEEPVDLVIGNPPYDTDTGTALEFCERALEFTAAGGEVAMHLRLGFLEAKRGSERDSFLERLKCDLYPLAKRCSYRGDGSTDSAPAGWFVWGPGRGERYMRLRAPGGT